MKLVWIHSSENDEIVRRYACKSVSYYPASFVMESAYDSDSDDTQEMDIRIYPGSRFIEIRDLDTIDYDSSKEVEE